MTAADELRAAAVYLQAMADEDDLYTASGGNDFGPMAPELARALADWLDSAAERQDATETAAERTWRNSDDTEARDRWVAGMTDQHALAVARLINPKEQ